MKYIRRIWYLTIWILFTWCCSWCKTTPLQSTRWWESRLEASIRCSNQRLYDSQHRKTWFWTNPIKGENQSQQFPNETGSDFRKFWTQSISNKSGRFTRIRKYRFKPWIRLSNNLLLMLRNTSICFGGNFNPITTPRPLSFIIHLWTNLLINCYQNVYKKSLYLRCTSHVTIPLVTTISNTSNVCEYRPDFVNSEFWCHLPITADSGSDSQYQREYSDAE